MRNNLFGSKRLHQQKLLLLLPLLQKEVREEKGEERKNERRGQTHKQKAWKGIKDFEKEIRDLLESQSLAQCVLMLMPAGTFSSLFSLTKVKILDGRVEQRGSIERNSGSKRRRTRVEEMNVR